MNLEQMSTQQAPFRFLGAAFWQWYSEHEADHWPVPVRILGISLRIPIEMKTLKGFFEVLFGPRPANA